MTSFYILLGIWAISIVLIDMGYRQKINKYENKIKKYERMLYLRIFTEENEVV